MEVDRDEGSAVGDGLPIEQGALGALPDVLLGIIVQLLPSRLAP